MDDKQKREVEKMIAEAIMKAVGFSTRKLGDTPTDAYQLTPRGYVQLNGTLANRPIGSVATIGQTYYATDTNIPMTFDGTQWRNGIGSVVAIN